MNYLYETNKFIEESKTFNQCEHEGERCNTPFSQRKNFVN